MFCDYSPYKLPTIDFVGGETQNLAFNIFYHRGDKPFSLSNCVANFSVVSLRNKIGTPILNKSMAVRSSNDGSVDNVLTVQLEPSETRDLSGRYIYEIQIKDSDGNIEIPKQGLLYITNNINKSFVPTATV